jgi:hypothetical protein
LGNRKYFQFEHEYMHGPGQPAVNGLRDVPRHRRCDVVRAAKQLRELRL